MNRQPIDRKVWAIAEGYIPSWSHGPEPEMTSHEDACILNAGDADAHVAITIFFEDREAVGPYRITVPARDGARIAWLHAHGEVIDEREVQEGKAGPLRRLDVRLTDKEFGRYAALDA